MALQQMAVLEAQAWELHQEVKRHGVEAGLKFIVSRVLAARRQGLNVAAPDTVDVDRPLSLFLVVCEKDNLFSAVALVHLARFMLLSEAGSNDRHELARTLKLLDEKAAVGFLRYAVDNSEWLLAMLVLSGKPGMQALSVLDTLVKKFHSDPDSHYATEMLLMRGEIKKEMLIDLVRFLVRVGCKELVEFAVKHGLISLREVTITLGMKGQKGVVLSALSIIAQSSWVAVRQGSEKDMDGVLCLAMESGLSTYHAELTGTHGIEHVESPVRLAVQLRRLDVLRLLYRTGAAHNAELFKVNAMLQEGLRSKVAEEAKVDPDTLVVDLEMVRICRYVRCAARQPRRLQDLCVLRMSHSLGCRPLAARTKAIESVLLWAQQHRPSVGEMVAKLTLKYKILFTDVLFDFSTETAYFAKDRDPRGVW